MSALTIGEVLKHLQEDFDDITISKIRFLETEGLISPDRTDSGYRKFADSDIDRLRYVLRAQRDRYLPLKVIKEELERIDAGLDVTASPTGPAAAEVARLRGEEATTDPIDDDGSLLPPVGDVRHDVEGLAEASGLTVEQVEALVTHGLLPRTTTHDAGSLRVARLAAELMKAGLEPRHLRMYEQFADRQVALIEQLIAPVLRQRNPEARSSAVARAERVAEAGAAMNRALLGNHLRDLLHS